MEKMALILLILGFALFLASAYSKAKVLFAEIVSLVSACRDERPLSGQFLRKLMCPRFSFSA
jgi:hypothetical protein